MKVSIMYMCVLIQYNTYCILYSIIPFNFDTALSNNEQI